MNGIFKRVLASVLAATLIFPANIVTVFAEDMTGSSSQSIAEPAESQSSSTASSSQEGESSSSSEASSASSEASSVSSEAASSSSEASAPASSEASSSASSEASSSSASSEAISSSVPASEVSSSSAASSEAPASSLITETPTVQPDVAPAVDGTFIISDEEASTGGFFTVKDGADIAASSTGNTPSMFSFFAAPKDETNDVDQLELQLLRYRVKIGDTWYSCTTSERTEEDGTPVTTINLPPNTTFEDIEDIRVRLQFNLLQNEDDREIKAGDYFELTLPQQFNVADTTSIMDINSGTINIAKYEISNNTIHVTFSQAVEDDSYFDIGGWLDLDIVPNRSGMTDGGPNTVTLQPQDKGHKYEFIIPAPNNGLEGIEKSGVYNSDTRTVTWTVKVGTATPNIPLAGITINETPSDQFILDDSFENDANADGWNDAFTAAVNGTPIEMSQLTKGENNSFSYTFPSDSTVVSPAELTFVMPVSPEVLPVFNQSTGKADPITYKNKAQMTPGEQTEISIVGSNEAEGEVTDTATYIDKTGEQVDSDNIAWVVTANSNSASHLWDVMIVDEISGDLNFLPNTLRIINSATGEAITEFEKVDDKADNSAKHTNWQYSAIPFTTTQGDEVTLLKIYFPNNAAIDSPYAVHFNTSHKSIYHDTVSEQNTAQIFWRWPNWSGNGPTGSPIKLDSPDISTSFNAAFINKTVVGDSTTGVLTWTLNPTISLETWDTTKITDVIGSRKLDADGKFTFDFADFDQKLVTNSVTLDYDGTPYNQQELINLGYLEVTQYAADNLTDHDTLVFDLPKDVFTDMGKVTITYQTNALDFVNGAYNNTQKDYNNIATIDVTDNGIDYADTAFASYGFKNDFVNKTSRYFYDFDRLQGIMEFTVTLNGNNMPLKQLSAQDLLSNIKTYVTYEDGSVVPITSDPASPIWTYVDGSAVVTRTNSTDPAGDVVYSAGDNSLTFTASASAGPNDFITSTYSITFQLQFNKAHDYLLKDNAVGVGVENTVTASSPQYNGGQPVTFTHNGGGTTPDFGYDNLSKLADYHTSNQSGQGVEGTEYIKWSVNINETGTTFDAGELILTDTIPAGLTVDYMSIMLYKSKSDGAGGLVADETDSKVVNLPDANKKLDVDSSGNTVLTVNLPTGALGEPVTLVYRTLITGTIDENQVTNKATLTYKGEEVGEGTASSTVNPQATGWLTQYLVCQLIKADEFGKEDRPIPGVTFTVYADEARTQLVNKGVTDNNGYVYFYMLNPDTEYWCVEETTPDGYVANNTEFKFKTPSTITGIPQTITIAKTFDNTRTTPGNISFTKEYERVNGDTNRVWSSNFTLYFYPIDGNDNVKQTVNVSGTIGSYTYAGMDSGGQNYLQVFTDINNGKVTVSGLPWGRYELVETFTTLNVYPLYNDKKTIVIDKNGAVTYDGFEGNQTNPVITNHPLKLTVTKESDDATLPLTGAVLSIRYDDNNSPMKDDNNPTDGIVVNGLIGQRLITTITAADAVTDTWKIEGLPAAPLGQKVTYWLCEDKGPDNTQLSDFSPIKFTVDEYGKIESEAATFSYNDATKAYEVTVIDHNANISLKKVSQIENNRLNRVADSVFELQILNGTTWTQLQNEDQTLDYYSKTTNSTDDIKFNVRRGQKYRLIETSLPTGYLAINDFGAANTDSITPITDSVRTVSGGDATSTYYSCFEFEVDEYGVVTADNTHNVYTESDAGGYLYNFNRNSQEPGSTDQNKTEILIRNELIVGHVQFTKYTSTGTDKIRNALNDAKFDIYRVGTGGQSEKITNEPLVSGYNRNVSGMPQSGFVSTLNAPNSTIDTTTGIAINQGLPAGTYYFKEAGTDIGYWFDDSVVSETFTITAENRYTKRTGSNIGLGTGISSEHIIEINTGTSGSLIRNYPLNSMVVVRKAGDNGTALAGASFCIETAGHIVNEITAIIGSLQYDDRDGAAHTLPLNDNYAWAVFRNVFAGTWTMTETVAPGAYNVNSAFKATFTVDQTQRNMVYEVVYDADDPANSTVTAYTADQWRTYVSALNSVDGAVVNTPITASFTKTASNGTTPLAGAKFTLTGVFANAAGVNGATSEPLSITTTASAVQFPLEGKYLVRGEQYTLKETAAPSGYIVSSLRDSYSDARLTADGSMTLRVTSAGALEYQTGASSWRSLAGNAVTVKDAPTSLTIKKLSTANQPLDGSEFEVSGTFVSAASPITLNASNSYTVEGQLIEGYHYLVTETKAPNGYKTTAPFDITVNAAGTVSISNTAPTGVDTDGTTIVNVRNTENSFSIIKTDENDVQIADSNSAVFTITPDAGSAFAGQDQTPLQLIGNNLTVTGKLIAGNTYTVKETTPPKGYKAIDDFKITIAPNGRVSLVGTYSDVTVTPDGTAFMVKNAQNTVSLAKQSTSGSPLSDAEFTVTGTFADNESRKVLNTANGYKLDGMLVAGSTYTVTENIPPKGYKVAQPFDITIDNNGNLSFVGAAPSYVTRSGTTFTVSDEPNTVSLAKVDENNDTLRGAEFEVSGTFASAASPIVLNDANGYTIETQLIAGNSYTVTETKAPNGYQTANPFSITINNDGDLSFDGAAPADVSLSGSTFTVKDMQNSISFVKIDSAATGNLLAGAKFKLTGTFTDGTTSKEFTTINAEPTTEANGLFTGKLIANNEYVLTEETPPDGYGTAFEPTTFRVIENGALQYKTTSGDWTPTPNRYEVSNTKNNLTITKLGVNNTPLNDAVFSVTGKFANTAGTSTKVLSKTNNVSNLEGELVAGETYTVSETTVPAGYTKIPDFRFIVNANGSTISAVGAWPASVNVTGNTASIIVTDTQTTFSISKINEDKSALPGAEFTITGTFADTSTSKVLLTNDASSETLTGQLIAGNSYTITETKAPDGCIKFAGIISFKVEDSGVITYTGSDADVGFANNAFTVTNHPLTVSISKTDLAGDTISTVDANSTAKYKISNQNTGFVDRQKEYTGTINEIVTYAKGNLFANTEYTLEEVTPPAGYTVNPNNVVFSVNESNVLSLVSTNNAGSVSGGALKVQDDTIKFTALKTDDNATALSGAQFRLAGRFSDSTTEKTWTSGRNAQEYTALLIAGESYTLTETTAPDGYIAIPEEMKFTVGNDGKLTLESGTISNVTVTTDGMGLIIENKPIIPTFAKQDRATQAPLDGAEFRVTGEFVSAIDNLRGYVSGTVQDIADKLAHNVLATKTYTLTETKAPNGYKLETTPILFTVNADGTLTFSGDYAGIATVDRNTITFTDESIVITAQKTDENGSALSGAELTLTGKFADDAQNTATKTWTSAATAQEFKTLLIAGETYRLAETKAPDGYLTLHGTAVLECNPDGTLTLTNDADSTVTLTPNADGVLIKNTKIAVGFNKVSTDGTQLTGGRFTVSGDFVGGESSITGSAETIADMLTGKLYASTDTTKHIYTIRENVAPNGYKLEAEETAFTVDGDAKVTIVNGEGGDATLRNGVLTYINEAIVTSITKTDAGGTTLAGARLTITGKFADGTTEQTWESTRSAQTFSALLIAGETYAITEPQAPSGHYALNGAVTFTVGVDGKLTIVDSADGMLLLTENGEGLQLRNYALPAVVQTGDNTPIGLLITLMLISALAIAAGVIVISKKRKKQ